MTPTGELVARIEDARENLDAVREAIEGLAGFADAHSLGHGRALEAAAGGVTCVIATLHAGQQQLLGVDGD